MSRRTWQPKQKKRIRKHGFLARMRSLGGQMMIKRRRAKGRTSLAVS
ncbi:MAG: 50S ribosomal protein L34 [Candidatus Pacebacteria bacterium]|nr:50S ribosomal protein L34 [Candidatus Paceibacterota bacterium]